MVTNTSQQTVADKKTTTNICIMENVTLTKRNTYKEIKIENDIRFDYITTNWSRQNTDKQHKLLGMVTNNKDMKLAMNTL